MKNMGENPEISIFSMMKVNAICISNKRGIQKHKVDEAIFIEDFGIEGDAHAGKWHRQVSILNQEAIDEFVSRGAEVFPGAFGENLIVSGLDLENLPMRSLLKIGDVILEKTQKGKECHSHCQIYHKMGECIMPKLGTFFEVRKGGKVKIGDEIIIMENPDKRFVAAVITLSDRSFNKEREDISGPTIVNKLKENDYIIAEEILLPDNKAMLKNELIRLSDQREIDLILTTGGTGFSDKDITPEATLEVIDRNAPGIAEAIRYESLKITKNAMLSRGVSGIRKHTLIINLPGSPKACVESMDVFLNTLPHALKLLRGEKVDK